MSTSANGSDLAAATSVRRAVLPWRRRIRPSRFDFTPGGGFANLLDEPLGLLLAVVLVPLWLPAAVVAVPALVELALEIVLLPFALLLRRSRGRWPVAVLAGDQVVSVEQLATSAAASRRAEELRGQLLLRG